MIDRLRDALAPRREAPVADRGYRRLLRWAALPVTDRRWAAPLAAAALGFGLFAGVAIGPGASGTLATAPFQLIEELQVAASGGGQEVEEGKSTGLAGGPSPEEGLGEEEGLPSLAPVVPEEESLEEGDGESEPVGQAPEDEKAAQEPDEQKLAGAVVYVNAAASSYTVVEAGGVMSAVHAAKLPVVGSEVEVPIETLANGTLAEAGKRRKTGTAKRATLAGIVTHIEADSLAPAYTVSNKGSSVRVAVHPDPAAALPPLPELGAYASVTVNVEPLKPAAASTSADAESDPVASQEAGPTYEPAPVVPVPLPPPAADCAPDPVLPAPQAPRGTLWQSQISGGGAPFTHADFAGIVTAICAAASQLLVSADGIREGGEDLRFAVPATIDTSKLGVGDSVLASADIAADGSLTLTGLASDERRKGADDAKLAQGDLAVKKPKSSPRPSR